MGLLGRESGSTPRPRISSRERRSSPAIARIDLPSTDCNVKGLAMAMRPITREAVILSAARTPVGKLQGALGTLSAAQLGAHAVGAAVERAGIADPARIDEVIVGNVVSAGLGQNIARQCALGAGLPLDVGAMTINKVCGASLKSAMLAAQAIRAGDGDLFVTGGVESMSQAPHLVDGRMNRAALWVGSVARCPGG